MKLPSIQFYIGDWRKDPGVQSLTYHDKGVWFEILCLMHESDQRGKLLLNGKPMPEEALARLLGLDKQNLTNTLTTLLSSGVADRCTATGALMNRRMVRDEEIRKIRQNCGKQGGNPRLLNQTSNQNPTTQDNQIPTPSVSTSASAINTYRGSGIPANEKEAVEWASMENVPAEFAKDVFHQCEGVNWKDGANRNITGWRSYIKQRYSKRQEVKPKGPAPVWQQIKQLESEIGKHPANHDGLCYDLKNTPEQRADFVAKFKTLGELRRQNG